jgi:hypothetical protein
MNPNVQKELFSSTAFKGTLLQIWNVGELLDPNQPQTIILLV